MQVPACNRKQLPGESLETFSFSEQIYNNVPWQLEYA